MTRPPGAPAEGPTTGEAGSDSTSSSGTAGTPATTETADAEPPDASTTGTSGEGSSSEGGTATTETGTTGDVDGFDPTQVSSCADIDLEGVCIDVHTAEELIATRVDCPYHEPCRVVVHPGTYVTDGSNFTYHHWFRHFIGVSVVTGERPVIISNGTSVFANKGHQEYQQNIILQNLVLSGPSMGVDFDGASGEPWLNKGGLSWLDRVKIDVDGPAIFFNSSPDGGGAGALWCTECELVRSEDAGQLAIVGAIDSAWFSDTVWSSDTWSSWTVRLNAQSVGLDNVVNQDGDAVQCGDFEIECVDGPMAEWLRIPTLDWFETLLAAQEH